MTHGDPYDWGQVFSALVEPRSRASGAVALAQSLGADDFIILLPDPKLAILRPAPGFPQTLAGGPTWAELFSRCDHEVSFITKVAHPTLEHVARADVFVAPDGAVFILIGDHPKIRATQVAAAAGLFVALLQSEAREDSLSASVRSAGDATRRALALASSLDRARGEAAQKAQALRAALSDTARLNEELCRLNQTLETRVRDAVAERLKAEDDLRQAQKMEAIGQLTGGVAHDFNNLLTPIIGSLDMLVRRGVGGEREQRLIEGALQSADRAKTLVQRLLAFARRQPLRVTAVDLRRLIADMEPLIDSTVGAAVDVRINIPADLPPLASDVNQLEMALLNLVVNARDAMPDGGRLAISAAVVSVPSDASGRLRDGQYIKLSVSDNGAGMDEATLSRAAEPFFSTKAAGSGTGLGLSMVHGLAIQQNGDLRIRSSVGRGTTVEVLLPVCRDTSHANAASEPSRIPCENRGTALLVDDEALVRMSTAAMLADLGYEVVEARSAEDALDLLKAGLSPDVLITDHVMPGMSGAHLAKKLSVEMPKLPVLIVSGYSKADEIRADLPRLSKPFRQADLAAKLLALRT